MADALSPDTPRGVGGADWTAARPVDVGQVERELEAMLGASKASDGGVATRARMSNLVVFATTEAAESGLNESLAEVSDRHPSRVLLLLADGEQEEQPRAWVSALCRSGDGGRRICSEQVSIRAGGEGLRRLPSVVRPLLVGDLPTALWWAVPTPPPLFGDLFFELAGMARRVLWDSTIWLDEAVGLRAVAGWADGVDPRIGLVDLAWVRLAPWRGAIARALGPAANRISSVRIQHGPQALPKALLLAGWLGDRLGWRRGGHGEVSSGSARWSMEAASGPVALEVVRVPEGPCSVLEASFGCAADAGSRITVRRIADGRLEVDPPLPGGIVAPALLGTPGDLVSRELPDLDGDPLFRSALSIARTLSEDVAA